MLRADVLPEAELAAGPHHATELAQGGSGIGDAAEHAHDDCRVQGPVVRRDRLGRARDDVDRDRRASCALLGRLPRGRVGLDGEDVPDLGG